MGAGQVDALIQPRRGLWPAWPWLLVVTAWGLVGLAVLTRHAYLLDHHQLMDGHLMSMGGRYMRMSGLHLPVPVALALFLASWQVMTAAMMLPSSLPTVALWAQAGRSRRHPRAALSVALAGFAAIWTVFGLVAFLGDLLLMRASDAWPWLGAHPWAIGAATLATAGPHELSPLKARCLAACRGPVQALVRCGQPGSGSAWRGGLRHGAHCLGSCWALMWIMCGTELAPVPVMVVLTAVMLAEKNLPAGKQLTQLVGSTLLLAAAVGLVFPAGLSLSA